MQKKKKRKKRPKVKMTKRGVAGVHAKNWEHLELNSEKKI